MIPDDQYRLYEAKRYNDTPILVGYNSDEGASFQPPRTPEAYITATRQRYGPFADSLLKLYPAGEKVVPKTARDLTRDAAFGGKPGPGSACNRRPENPRRFCIISISTRTIRRTRPGRVSAPRTPPR